MELRGELDSDDQKVYEKFLVPLSDKLKNELQNLPPS